MVHKELKNLWNGKIEFDKVWPQLQIDAVESSANRAIKVGDDLTISAWIKLGDLTPEDVCVQIYHGLIGTNGDIIDGEVVPLKFTTEKKGSLSLFSGRIKYFRSGRHGYTVRIVPNNPDLSSPFDTKLILWASEPIGVTA